MARPGVAVPRPGVPPVGVAGAREGDAIEPMPEPLVGVAAGRVVGVTLVGVATVARVAEATGVALAAATCAAVGATVAVAGMAVGVGGSIGCPGRVQADSSSVRTKTTAQIKRTGRPIAPNCCCFKYPSLMPGARSYNGQRTANGQRTTLYPKRRHHEKCYRTNARTAIARSARCRTFIEVLTVSTFR